jgi:PAS domain S-box-containing protein
MEITFKNIVDSLTVPTFVLNKDHEVVAWNRACENLTGVKAEDIIGTKEAWRGFYDQPRPCLADFVIDEKATDSESWYSIASRAKYGIGQHAEAWFPNLNGKKAYLMIDAEPMFDADGELIAVVENLEDITDIKVVEDRLRLSDKVFTYTNQSILITDAKRRIVQVNQSFTRLTGYELTEITGENPSILQSGKHGVDFYRDMNASIQTTGHWEGEIWDRRKDGTIIQSG